MADVSGTSIISDLSFDREMHQLRETIGNWIDRADDELSEALKWQFTCGLEIFSATHYFLLLQSNA
jgi:hypothetical protein